MHHFSGFQMGHVGKRRWPIQRGGGLFTVPLVAGMTLLCGLPVVGLSDAVVREAQLARSPSRAVAQAKPKARRPAIRYVPPKQGSAPKVTSSNTTRDICPGQGPGRVLPLTPSLHVGQTHSSHPTFIWFSADSQPYAAEFRLFSAQGTPLYRRPLTSQPGLTALTLPTDQPPLAVGQRYQWQVVVRCVSPSLTPPSFRAVDPAIPTVPAPPPTLAAPFPGRLVSARSLIATAEIDVVDLAPDVTPPPDLAPAVAMQRYAEAGLWFDAIARGWPRDRAAMLGLLESLAQQEAPANPDRAQQLRQVIEQLER
jgi:hypothetical protein